MRKVHQPLGIAGHADELMPGNITGATRRLSEDTISVVDCTQACIEVGIFCAWKVAVHRASILFGLGAGKEYLDLEEEDPEEGHMLQLKLTTKLLFLDTYIYITQCGVVWSHPKGYSATKYYCTILAWVDT